MTDPQRPLSMRETLACVDPNGRIRCPSCGKFSSFEKITRDNSLRAGSVSLSLTPRCDKCAPEKTV